MFYLDWPGYDGGEVPAERLFPHREDASRAALDLYRRRGSTMAKVVVCAYPSSRRVITISGARSNPSVVVHDAQG